MLHHPYINRPYNASSTCIHTKHVTFVYILLNTPHTSEYSTLFSNETAIDASLDL